MGADRSVIIGGKRRMFGAHVPVHRQRLGMSQEDLAVPGAVAGWRVAGWGISGGHKSTVDGRLNVVTTPGVTPSVAATPGDTVPGPCRITPLALPSGAGPLEVTGADPSGRYVMPTLTPARWDLRTGEVELLAPQTRGQAVDGNPAGDVIVEDNGGQRVLLHDGRRVTLDAVAPTAFLKPAVVGDTGLWLAGTQYEDANSANGKRIPVLWRC